VKILYDFRKEFEAIPVGQFHCKGPISTRADAVRMFAEIELIEDVKTIRIPNRTARESGIDIQLADVEDLQAGDRITITGRVYEPQAYGRSWCIALLIPGGNQITQAVAPDSIFYLSHILEEADLTTTFAIHTIGWGALQPLMDFYIDNVLIIRKEEDDEIETDTRTVVYSLVEDAGIQWDGDDTDVFSNTLLLLLSGMPSVSALKCGNEKALHIGNRVNDFDGIDINLGRLKLRPGNQYKVTITGRMGDDVPAATSIMFQGLPGYTWKCQTPVSANEEFTLIHNFSQSDIEKWSFLRITTNSPGASASFCIYGIDMVRL